MSRACWVSLLILLLVGPQSVRGAADREVVYFFSLDTNPGWSVEGQWAWGQPTGGGGEWGHTDPWSGHTGTNVFGYNLNGDYANSMPEYNLTTGALDFTGYSMVRLRFWRWLNVEEPAYDHAYVRISRDGVVWPTVWANHGEITDSSWTAVTIDISDIADEHQVYLRWTMGTTDYISPDPRVRHG